MASTNAKRRIVSNTLAVRRSGKTIDLHKVTRYESVGPTFQRALQWQRFAKMRQIMHRHRDVVNILEI
jgi:hypothetical protein